MFAYKDIFQENIMINTD